MLIILFLVLHFNFLFVPCGRLSWLPVSFLLHVKHTLSYRIVSYAYSVFRKIRTYDNVFYFSVRVSSSHDVDIVDSVIVKGHSFILRV